jgi:hypothetical protein
MRKSTIARVFAGMIFAQLGSNSQAAEIEIPVHVKIAFKTTLTVERTANPTFLATAFVFAMDKQLYAPIDGPWDAVNCDTTAGSNCENCTKATKATSFRLTDLLLSCPDLLLPATTRLNITFGYKPLIGDTSVPLFSAKNLTPAQFQLGSFAVVKTAAFQTFADDVENDVLTEKCRYPTRRFNKVFFSLKVEVVGATASELQAFEHADMSLLLKASVETTSKFKM